jgi:hypothetical protein
MNTGIQDAGNLAWKLHHVLSLGAPESLLDSYEAERRPNALQLVQFTHQIVTAPTLTGQQEQQMRDDILVAVGGVPGVTEALARRFSIIAIGYGHSDEPFAPGTRVNPDTINADDLTWSLLTPDAAPPDFPAAFKVTVSNDVSQPIAVRPDGIVASAEEINELFGPCCDYTCKQVRGRSRRSKAIGGLAARTDQRAIPGVVLERHAVGDSRDPRRQHLRRRPIADAWFGRARTVPERIGLPRIGNPTRGGSAITPHRHVGLQHVRAWRDLPRHRHRRGADATW